jgi:hypothetical protein
MNEKGRELEDGKRRPDNFEGVELFKFNREGMNLSGVCGHFSAHDLV